MVEPEPAAPQRMLYTDAGEFPLLPDLAERARGASIEIVSMDGHDREEIIRRGASCRGAFLYRARIDEELLAAVPKWRILARVGTGYDLIDMAAAERRGLVVTYVPDFCTEELSDMVLLFTLAFARRLPTFVRAQRDRRWLPVSEIPQPGRLVGRTLGILGFGRSGRRAAEKARAFGLEVLVWTRTPRPDALARIGALEASFDDVLACDYVSVHTPLTPATAGLIDRDALAKMKPSGVLINVARGGIVDTDALVDALRAGQLAGAGLDVVSPAPLPASHPLWDLPNVIVTSHSGGLSTEAARESQTIAVEDAIAVLTGRQPRYPVPELAPAYETAPAYRR